MSGTVDLSAAKRELFERLMRGDGATTPAPMLPVTPRTVGATVPLSADQRQVWLHAAMAPDAPLYNESITIHRRGALDVSALSRALDELVRRHEAWRTTFPEVGGEVVQRVHPAAPVPLARGDVSPLPEGERDAAARAIAADDARLPLPLATGPLFRARLVRLAEDDHRLYLTLHHIIFDGVSIYRVIVPELAALYEAFAAGRPSPLPEPALHYGDYALWQRQHLETPGIQRQLDHWRRTLADAPPKLELTGDRVKPAVATQAGSMEVFAIPHALTEALKALSRAEGVTLYMTLLAAFKAMLLRYTGEQDLIVGGVTDLRRRPELERVVGYFLNTLALRTRAEPALPFRTWLARVRDAVLGALGASEVPFDEVVRALDVRRTPGAHPLFNILFSIEPPVEPFPAGWDLTQMDVVVGAAKFELYLELDERPDGMAGRFLYSTELFDAATIRRMIGHWLTMLEGIVAAPDTTLAALPMVTAGERAEQARWNDTARVWPAITLPALVAEQAARTPHAPAVAMGDERWNYARLDDAADAVADRLAAAGIGRGALVAVVLDRAPATVAALLGVLRAGAAYLPLDPGFPPARLDMIVADARPAALLTDAAVGACLPNWPLPRVLIDATPVPPAPRVEVTGCDLAYLLYTSGSTGRPKGVEIRHDALLNLLLSMREQPGFVGDDRLLAVTTLSFDIAALELFLPLVSGGEVVLASRETATDPVALAALIAAERPSVMQATPATWRALLEVGWTGAPHLRALCGGEALPRALADALGPKVAELWNMYGPTETTIWSLVHRVEAGDGPVPIGRPVANTRLLVRDATGQPAPAGVVGELLIGGAGLARGYRGRPDLTAERFVALDGERWYRTGDLARFAADGTVFCLGRTDAEEKIRGFRVAVEEVEGALVRHPRVAAAAVRGWPDASGARALAAYVVAAGGGAAPTAAELRAAVAETLPDYMVPSSVDLLPALPMTANGKIDRARLPTPSRAGIAAPDAAPQGEAERRLAAIWCDVLGLDAVGRHDSFFDLGGHSLLVARLLAHVERAFGRRVAMAGFFRAHRLDEMAAMLSRPESDAEDGLVPVQPHGWRPPLLWLDAGPTFRALGQAIAPDQPLLGLPVDPVLERRAGTRYTIEEVAADVIAAIRAARPAGPYYLGGWCTSGILAFEVARQLRAAGAQVPLLVLAHAVNPVALREIGRLAMARAKLRFHSRELLRQPVGSRWRYLGQRVNAVLESLRLSRARTAEGTHGALRAALDAAAWRYVPGSYDGDVVLFQPLERVDGRDGEPGWRRSVSGRFAAEDVAGGHRTMLEPPFVSAFGARLRAVLAARQDEV